MGPLTEIDFWRRRSRNISGIHEQIKHPVRMNASWVVFVSINFLFVFPHFKSLPFHFFFSFKSALAVDPIFSLSPIKLSS